MAGGRLRVVIPMIEIAFHSLNSYRFAVGVALALIVGCAARHIREMWFVLSVVMAVAAALAFSDRRRTSIVVEIDNTSKLTFRRQSRERRT
jgi:hypothetical protein